MAVLTEETATTRSLEWLARLLLTFLLAGAAVAKMIDPLVTARAVSALSWPVLSPSAGLTISVVSGVEIAIAAGLLGLPKSRAPLLGVVLLVAAFSLVLARLLSLAVTPSCGCMGWLFPSGNPTAEAAAGLVRNAGMLGMAGWLLWNSRRSTRQSARLPRAPNAGFTLIELLVSIAILAILIAILLPALSRSKFQSQLTAALSDLRQVTAATSLYCGDNQDGYMYVAMPEEPWKTLVVEGTPIPSVPYFAQAEWVLSLAQPDYIPNRQFLEFPSLQDQPGPIPIYSRFEMTHTAFARREYWRGEAPPDSLSPYKGCRLADVVFPASKGLFTDNETSVRRLHRDGDGALGPWVFGRADGGAVLVPVSDAANAEFSRPYGALPWPIMSTTDGLAGRDF